MKYELICSDDTDDVKQRVEEMIIKGWELYEGPQVTYNTIVGYFSYTQAMIKKDEVAE